MSADLVPIANVAELETLTPEAREVAVTHMLGEARSWLAHAVEATEPARIAEFKAFIATVAESTRQLNLAKGIQLDAQEMVRRAERGVGLAIRKGQEAGEIAKQHDPKPQPSEPFGRVREGRQEIVRPPAEPRVRDASSRSPSEFLRTGSDMAQTYDVTDGVTDEQFEEVLAEAKAEENLSRANVVRKVRAKRDNGTTDPEPPEPSLTDSDDPEWIPEPRDNSRVAVARRRQIIRDMAAQAYTSTQIGERLDVHPRGIRRIARAENIDIHADTVMGRGNQTIDSNRIVRETVNQLEHVHVGLNLIRYDELDTAEVENWIASLSKSIAVLNRLKTRLKETFQ